MTGASQSSTEIIKHLYAEYQFQAKEHPQISIMLGYEFFGLEKIRTIAPDATAFFFRQSPSNIMLQCVYDGKAANLKELEDEARGMLRRMKQVASEGGSNMSYGNYTDGGYFPTEGFLLVSDITTKNHISLHMREIYLTHQVR